MTMTKKNASARRKLRKKSGLDMFLKETFDSSRGPLVRQRPALVQSYHGLPQARRAFYEAQAEAANAASMEYGHVDFNQFCALEPGRLPSGLQEQAVKRSLDDMRCHGLWSSGAGLASFDGALKEELVNTTDTNQTVKGKLKSVFNYIPDPFPNPTGRLSLRPICPIAGGGLCKHDELYAACIAGTYNLYAVFQRLGLQKKCPHLIRLSAGTTCTEAAAELHFIASFWGKGEFAIMLKATIVGVAPGGRTRVQLEKFNTGISRPRPVCTTSQLGICRILKKSAEATRVAPASIESLKIERFAYVRSTDTDEYEVILGESTVHDLRLKKTQLKAPPKPSLTMPFGLCGPKAAAAGAPPPAPADHDAVTSSAAAHHSVSSDAESEASSAAIQAAAIDAEVLDLKDEIEVDPSDDDDPVQDKVRYNISRFNVAMCSHVYFLSSPPHPIVEYARPENGFTRKPGVSASPRIPAFGPQMDENRVSNAPAQS